MQQDHGDLRQEQSFNGRRVEVKGNVSERGELYFRVQNCQQCVYGYLLPPGGY